MSSKVNVLMVGTGEYTTGYVGGSAADSDKGAGVVALTMFDLRRRSKVDRLGMCGVNVSLLFYTFSQFLNFWQGTKSWSASVERVAVLKLAFIKFVYSVLFS